MPVVVNTILVHHLSTTIISEHRTKLRVWCAWHKLSRDNMVNKYSLGYQQCKVLSNFESFVLGSIKSKTKFSVMVNNPFVS